MSEIEIPIEVQVKLTGGWGGERLDVCSVIDKRTGLEVGDVGIYEFDAYSDFPSALMNAILTLLREVEEFETGRFYSVSIKVCDGGTEIGSATQHFRA